MRFTKKQKEQMEKALELIDKGDFNSNNIYIKKMTDTLKYMENQGLLADKDSFIQWFRDNLALSLSPMGDANGFVSPDPY